MACFAVIDTETNWEDRVMSIGVCVADMDTFRFLGGKYYILDPEYQIGGMYESVLFPGNLQHILCSRQQALQDLKGFLNNQDVQMMFAYNAGFDRNHLPELSNFTWYDIMRLAAYRQTNPKISACADCFRTGKLKRGYGVEPILRLLSDNEGYHETHNALYDAYDELQIMRLLGHKPGDYIPL